MIIGDPLMPEFLLEIIVESVLKPHLMSERTFINLFLGKYIQSTINYLRPYPFNFVLYDIRLWRKENFFFFINLFICFYFWPCWVFIVVHGLLIVVASRCGARALGARASVVVAHGLSSCGHGLSCSVARGIFPDQGLNPCPLHWQADS